MRGRIACLYLPSFPLQVHVRRAPHLAGRAFAVSGRGERPALVACSRAAWDAGLRPSMTATQARALAPEVEILPGEPPLYRRSLEALAEALLPLSATVDIGGEDGEREIAPHRAIYLRVPARTRGSRFGELLLSRANRHGLRARAGVADDRFTAWAAALTGRSTPAPLAGRRRPFNQGCTVVPRGGSAAFLAPLPIDLLPLDGDIRHMLRTLGVTTLGDFAALPPPTVGTRWNARGVDYQKLARGSGPTLLQGFVPTLPVVEQIDLEDEIAELEPLAFVLRPLADRACERLRGRGTAAEEAVLSLLGPKSSAGERSEISLRPTRPSLDGRALVELARAKLAELSLDHPVASVELAISVEGEPEPQELDLFDAREGQRAEEAMNAAIARLRAAFGEASTGSAELIDTHRPESAFRLRPFRPPGASGRRTRRTRRAAREPASEEQPLPAVMNGMVGALRLIEPPAPQPEGLRAIELEGSRARVVASRGPTRLQAEWWSSDPIERDYYEVETEGGGRYWVFRDRTEGRFYLHGIFD